MARAGNVRTAVAVLGMLVAAVRVPAAQSPVRDRDPRTAAEESHLGSISGRVTLAGADRPARRVSVRLNGDLPESSRIATVDSTGAFRFDDLPADRYSLMATRPGFVPAFYGSLRPGRGPGARIAVQAGEDVRGIELSIAEGAVLAGRVLDEYGLPVVDIEVTAFERRRLNGVEELVPLMHSQSTNDRGEFRLYGLPPGDLTIMVMPALRAPTAPSPQRTTADLLQWAASHAAGTPAGTPPSGAGVTHAPIYYPGTLDPGSARTFALSAGEERTGLDLQLTYLPTAEVRGRVLRPDGRPAARARVTIRSAADGPALGWGQSTGSDGRFSFPSVVPGRYNVIARDTAVELATEADTGVEAIISRPSGLWATTGIDVGIGPVSVLDLVLQPGLTMNGRVMLDQGSYEFPERPPLLRVSLVAPPGERQAGSTTASASVDRDGRFVLPAVVPGRYVLRLSGIPSGWLARSALADGHDLLDVPIEVNGTDPLPELFVTLTREMAGVRGRVLDAENHPLHNLALILFSTNPDHWLTTSRRTRVLTPATDGQFDADGLPAGTYYLAAVTDPNQVDLGDAAQLEQLAAAAIRVTLVRGEVVEQDVQSRQ